MTYKVNLNSPDFVSTLYSSRHPFNSEVLNNLYFNNLFLDTQTYTPRTRIIRLIGYMHPDPLTIDNNTIESFIYQRQMPFQKKLGEFATPLF